MAHAPTEELQELLRADCGLRTSLAAIRSRPNSGEPVKNGSCGNSDNTPKDLSSQKHDYETSNHLDNGKCNGERSELIKAVPKSELKLDGCKGSGGVETHSSTSTSKRKRTYSMANGISNESKPITTLDTASQDNRSSSSGSSASDTAGERPASGSDENDADYFMDSSPKDRIATGRKTEPSSARDYSSRTSYTSLLNNLRVCGNEILRDLGGSISGPEDDCDRPATAGSELTTAAYNNFVRRIVDDTLDRTVTFCEQPRHAITALETICAKAWPRMEMKRHRNRIRAYLKACRRNSKKNKGQINMKEAPMNGLSIEARQLVSNALSLVADDVDQLKQAVNRDDSKSRPVATSKPNNTSLNKNPISNSDYITRPQTGAIDTDLKRGHSEYGATLPDPAPSLLEKYGGMPESLCVSDKALPRAIGCRLDGPVPPCPNSGLNPFSSHFGTGSQLEATYMAAMLRLLPTMFQFTNSSSDPMSSFNNHKLPSTNNVNAFSSMDSFSNPHIEINNPTVGAHSFSSLEPQKLESRLSFPTSAPIVPNETSEFPPYDIPRVDRKPNSIVWSDSKAAEAPPAHLTSAQYSPTLNEATTRLLDVRPLTQDDVDYFRHNVELSQEAIKYAKGVARLVLKKTEVLESQLTFPVNGIYLNPVNLS
ncbi:hypothetical protein D915_005515 [Fasciola hepatica]|uniref:Nucleolar protein 4 helical domain-containing protein n=1 Tax=Fasciola hepatica TaxID=6192 RepID=A0A4E0RAL5_FASHE|nr:hypothetical protein D915_005515 [Fasciola hepatica]